MSKLNHTRIKISMVTPLISVPDQLFDKPEKLMTKAPEFAICPFLMPIKTEANGIKMSVKKYPSPGFGLFEGHPNQS